MDNALPAELIQSNDDDQVLDDGADDEADEESSRVVPESDATAKEQPLTEAFMNIFEMPTMSAARKAVRSGLVYVNGVKRKADFSVHAGERIEYRQRTEGAPALDKALVPEELRTQFCVLHEDDDFAVICKPEGVETVSGEKRVWSALRLAHHFLRPSRARGAFARAKAVHRLDAPTSGLVCLAKTQPAHAALAGAFAARKVRKKYLALLPGPRFDTLVGRIDLPLRNLQTGRSDMQEACTEYEVLSFTPTAEGQGLSTVAFRPLTGRTHQLRRHAAQALGRPILGDSRYGDADEQGQGLFLSAVELVLPRLDNCEETRTFTAAEPAKFDARRKASAALHAAST